MKLTLNEMNARRLNAQTARALASREQFSDDTAWLKAILTRYCGAFPDALEAQVTQIFALCNDAVDDLHKAKADLMKRDAVLTEAQWKEIFSVTDALNPFEDEQASERIGQQVRDMVESLSCTALEQQFCRLYELENHESPDPDELAAMSPSAMRDSVIRMTDAYVADALEEKNLPATLRAMGSAAVPQSAEEKAERRATVRALTAILASRPEYRSRLENGTLKMQAIASAAYAVVETDALAQALPEADWAEITTCGLGAVFCTVIIAFLVYLMIELASGGALVLSILGVYALLYAVFLGTCLTHIYRELCPAGLMQTKAVCTARHALAKVSTGAGNLLRDARNELTGRPAVPHKVVVDAPQSVRSAPRLA